MEALDSLVRSGKVRYIGCSNWSGWHMMKGMEVARRDGRVPFVAEQIHYTLQAREAEYELIPIALDQKLGILVWSPLAGGLLSGKYGRGDEAGGDGRRAAGPDRAADEQRAAIEPAPLGGRIAGVRRFRHRIASRQGPGVAVGAFP